MADSNWRSSAAGVLVVIASCAGAGCGDDEPSGQAGAGATSAPEHGLDSTTTTPPMPTGPEAPAAHCPPRLENCATASGSIIYIERVDPDGDGDAHLVLASEEGITFEGVSVIDVSAELRPRPLPAIGDHVSAAGPIYTGSYGQRQVEAIELNLAE